MKSRIFGKECWIACCLGMAVVLGSCTDSTSDKPITYVDTVMTDTLRQELEADTLVIREEESDDVFALQASDRKLLDLLYTVNLGFSYSDTKNQYPSLKATRPEEKKEELAAAGLTESVNKLQLFGSDVAGEFNFKNDTLYSYFFTYTEKDSEKAEKVFYAVVDYYAEKLGEPKPDKVEEENHYSQVYLWPSVKGVVPFISFNLNTNTLIWGKRSDKQERIRIL
jgi:hypothetical protein